MVFGEELLDHFMALAKEKQCSFLGIVARPLYRCSYGVDSNNLCGQRASMSALLSLQAESQHWLCADHEAKTPAPGGVLRILEAYIMVRTTRSAREEPSVEEVQSAKFDPRVATPMRMEPVQVIVSAPPPEWKWGLPETIDPNATMTEEVMPNVVKEKGCRDRYVYDAAASAWIWKASQRYIV